MSKRIDFLETITFMGNDVLVPVKNIRTILCRQTEKGFEIAIEEKGTFTWVENFPDEKTCQLRYREIKILLNAK